MALLLAVALVVAGTFCWFLPVVGWPFALGAYALAIVVAVSSRPAAPTPVTVQPIPTLTGRQKARTLALAVAFASLLYGALLALPR